MNTAILFLVFNRPAATLQVFERIRQIKPRRLYVTADGPRVDRPDDAVNCKAVRDIFDRVDWDCRVTTLFREENLGCKRSVSEGISWFFEHEEDGIILEDDCLPDSSFFGYCSELLERYRFEDKIMAIGANDFLGGVLKAKIRESYFFSRHIEIWGWATWRRAWNLYDRDMTSWKDKRSTDWLLKIGNGNKIFDKYWKDNLDAAWSGKIDTWDIQWVFSVWANDGFTVLPCVNLVTNIGFNGNATHTTNYNDLFADIAVEPIKLPLVHNDDIVVNNEIDALIDAHIIKINRPFFKRWISLIYKKVFVRS